MKKEKVFRKITIGFLSLMLLGLFATVTSCNDDDEKYYDVTHNVVYKAEGAAGVNITKVTHNSEGVNEITVGGGTTWTSPEIKETYGVRVGRPFRMPKTVIVDATGESASSTLKVQIYIDGVLKKEVITSGKDLHTRADYEVEWQAN